MGRKGLVRLVAWLLRPRKSGEPRMEMAEINDLVRKCFPHRDWEWRTDVYEDAMDRNYRKAGKKA